MYIVQTIYLIFIKIKEKKDPYLSLCMLSSRRGGLGSHPAGQGAGQGLLWDAPVPVRALPLAGALPCGVEGCPWASPRVFGRQPWAYLFLD